MYYNYLIINIAPEYSCAAEPPVRCGVSHLSRRNEPLYKEAREAIGRHIYTYNFERCHQSIGNKRPAEVYYPVMLLDAARAAA